MPKISLIAALLCSVFFCNAQTVIHGFVRDSVTKEALIGATVALKNTANKVVGTQTDSEGFFSININDMNGSAVELMASYVGYTPSIMPILARDSSFTIFLQPQNTLNDVVIKSSAIPIEQRNEMSVTEIPVTQIKTMPRLFGEADVIRALQLTPGVQAGREGGSGMYVRGGTPDQNLFLVDDVPLYYVSHVGGFVSVFDANALNSVKMYKGGFPARFGGRLSAIVDMRLREGNRDTLKGEYGIGVLSTQLFLEGPLRIAKKQPKGNTTFLLSARRSNLDLFTRLAFLLQDSKNSGGYVFYDATAKLTHRLSETEKISSTIYWGTDIVENTVSNEGTEPKTGQKVTTTSSGGITWGNIGASVRYSKVYSPKLIGNLTATYTQFEYGTRAANTEVIGTKIKNAQFSFKSLVQDINLKANFDYNWNEKHHINGGINTILHSFTPGVQSFVQTGSGGNIDSSFNNVRLFSPEANVYIEDDWTVLPNLSIVAGLYTSAYFTKDTTTVTPQPRFLLNWNFAKTWSFKTSATRMQQHLHLLSNSGAGLPTDIWVPATKRAPSETSWQYVAGIAHTFKNLGLEFSAETYYKTMENVLEFKDGASFFSVNKGWEDKVQTGGIARCYGLELFLQKKEGNTTGWISYTLARNERQFAALNKGKWYPYKYDQTHNFAIVVQHQFSKKYSLTGTWVYNTGNALTMPIGRVAQATYPADGQWYRNQDTPPVAGFWYPDGLVFEGKNNYRMPDYHRLDIALNITTKNTKDKLITWNIGVYNAYNRQNPYYLYYDKNEQGKTALFQYSLFPIIPFVHYTCKFK